jgi:hypothetical protein
VVVKRSEFDYSLVLEGFDRSKPEAEAGAWCARRLLNSVVRDLESEGAVRAAHLHGDIGGIGVLGGVAERFGEDCLGEGLEAARNAHRALPADTHARVFVLEALESATEGELGLSLGGDESAFERSAQLAEDGLKLGVGAGAVFLGKLALGAQDE